MSTFGGATTRETSVLEGHPVGTGPDSIYVHAVAPKAVAGGPVAICGYPLRETTLHTPADGECGTFEELAQTVADCCPECRRALALDAAVDRPARARDGSRAWMKWVIIVLGTATSLGGLVRVAVAIVQRL